jgi:hypothetical protein
MECTEMEMGLSDNTVLVARVADVAEARRSRCIRQGIQ